jgi:hypothetical protein
MSVPGDRLVSASPAQAAFEEKLAAARARKDARKAARSKPKAKRPAGVPEVTRHLADAWHRMPWLQQCEVCRAKPAESAHHVVREQTIRACAYRLGYDFEVVRWDVRNRLWICGEDCHEPHTQASKRIHVSKLRPDTFEFIVEYGFEWALEKEYDHSPIEEVA